MNLVQAAGEKNTKNKATSKDRDAGKIQVLDIGGSIQSIPRVSFRS